MTESESGRVVRQASLRGDNGAGTSVTGRRGERREQDKENLWQRKEETYGFCDGNKSGELREP